MSLFISAVKGIASDAHGLLIIFLDDVFGRFTIVIFVWLAIDTAENNQNNLVDDDNHEEHRVFQQKRPKDFVAVAIHIISIEIDHYHVPTTIHYVLCHVNAEK